MNYMPKWVAEAAGISTELAAMCLIALAGSGLANTLSLYGGIGYSITDLGDAVLKSLEAIRTAS